MSDQDTTTESGPHQRSAAAMSDICSVDTTDVGWTDKARWEAKTHLGVYANGIQGECTVRIVVPAGVATDAATVKTLLLELFNQVDLRQALNATKELA